MRETKRIEFGICIETDNQIICKYQSDSILEVLEKFQDNKYDPDNYFITVYELIDCGQGVKTYAVADLMLDYLYVALSLYGNECE